MNAKKILEIKTDCKLAFDSQVNLCAKKQVKNWMHIQELDIS